MMGTAPTNMPEFGYKARVPLLGGKPDRTEVDMKLGTLLVEAKLTESDFQAKSCSVLESYRDFRTVFEVSALPRSGDQHCSYQLIRNVLAAYAAGLSFCVIADARRQDLVEAWYATMRCVRVMELRTRCKVLTWQELSPALPRKLQRFLEAKYGIFASRCRQLWYTVIKRGSGDAHAEIGAYHHGDDDCLPSDSLFSQYQRTDIHEPAMHLVSAPVTI